MEYEIGDLIEIKHKNIESLVVLDLSLLSQKDYLRLRKWNPRRPTSDNFTGKYAIIVDKLIGKPYGIAFRDIPDAKCTMYICYSQEDADYYAVYSEEFESAT